MLALVTYRHGVAPNILLGLVIFIGPICHLDYVGWTSVDPVTFRVTFLVESTTAPPSGSQRNRLTLLRRSGWDGPELASLVARPHFAIVIAFVGVKNYFIEKPPGRLSR